MSRYLFQVRALLPLLLLIPFLFSCSSGKPPEEMFRDNINKMVLIDRAMGFNEEVTAISVVKVTEYEDQVEVVVRVEGWATHPDLRIGATLPASKTREPGWATWKFFLVRSEDVWTIREKFKVEEGYGNSP